VLSTGSRASFRFLRKSQRESLVEFSFALMIEFFKELLISVLMGDMMFEMIYWGDPLFFDIDSLGTSTSLYLSS